ncbi:MAG: YbhB/YbcL family Raf kinase inhibitor-like protein, partial [Stenotrophobium sp.]
MRISSSAFAHNAEIPARYTCEGQDLSPPLQWSGLPAGTKSLV